MLLRYPLTIDYAPGQTEASAVMTVLPRASCVETLDGMVTIAERGTKLPTKCQHPFVRHTDSPNMTLKLFQERAQVGEIRIEELPPEVGRGARVNLSVEVNEKGEIRGSAAVHSSTWKLIKSVPVLIRIAPRDVPDRDELDRRFRALSAEWEEIGKGDDQRVQSLGASITGQLRLVERMLNQVPLERQEIAVALDGSSDLVHPPAYDMHPSKDGFLRLVEQCGQTIDFIGRTPADEVDPAELNQDDRDHQLLRAERTAQRSAELRETPTHLHRDGLATPDR